MEELSRRICPKAVGRAHLQELLFRVINTLIAV
jgi:hypothetical protein